MKRVLITGKDSYIGSKIEERLVSSGYQVDVLDMIGDGWINYGFSGYDTVIHVAGIAHRKYVSDDLYEQVNHLLPVKVAKVASEAGVGQFIFMSSGAVFSQNDRKHKSIIVNEQSELAPLTAYGISKMKAEEDLSKIKTDMKIAVIRPPMVYGPGAKGNYNSLSKFAKLLPIIPKVNNQRSMIYIDNLTSFIELLVNNSSEGIFMPQNKEYVNTCEMIRRIANYNNKTILILNGFGWVIGFAGLLSSKVNKAFGTFIYEHPDVEYFNGAYQIVGFDESIATTEAYGKRGG